MAFKNYEEFWPFYLSQHSKVSTRAWHFMGTSFVFVCIALAIWKSPWYLLLAPLVAYGIAWFSHFFIEGNKPATFGHPVWSLRADFRMYRMILFGQLNNDLKKYEITTSL
ncbi:Mpo1-like protein [Fictibacillus nanhaiensis]|uniref:Mpo1-like protein n=1 Tax=Fictibacillus nanhaiensis TaxID=742169 RepID=UPI003C19ED10